MAEEDAQHEPTMEEILSSIRRIISEDGEPVDQAGAPAPAAGAEPAPAAAGDEEGEEKRGADVLDLTDMVQEDGTVVSLKRENAAEPQPEPEPEPEPRPTPRPEPAPEPMQVEPEPEPPEEQVEWADAAEEAVDGGLTSERTAAAAADAFAGLAGAAHDTGAPLGNGQRTVEDVVRELLRPMLRQWLDRHLRTIVTRAVEREVAKLAGRADKE